MRPKITFLKYWNTMFGAHLWGVEAKPRLKGQVEPPFENAKTVDGFTRAARGGFFSSILAAGSLGRVRESPASVTAASTARTAEDHRGLLGHWWREPANHKCAFHLKWTTCSRLSCRIHLTRCSRASICPRFAHLFKNISLDQQLLDP